MNRILVVVVVIVVLMAIFALRNNDSISFNNADEQIIAEARGTAIVLGAEDDARDRDLEREDQGLVLGGTLATRIKEGKRRLQAVTAALTTVLQAGSLAIAGLVLGGVGLFLIRALLRSTMQPLQDMVSMIVTMSRPSVVETGDGVPLGVGPSVFALLHAIVTRQSLPQSDIDVRGGQEAVAEIGRFRAMSQGAVMASRGNNQAQVASNLIRVLEGALNRGSPDEVRRLDSPDGSQAADVEEGQLVDSGDDAE